MAKAGITRSLRRRGLKGPKIEAKPEEEAEAPEGEAVEEISEDEAPPEE